MKIEDRKGVFLKVGEYVKIINHKFPETHPKALIERMFNAPDSFKARKDGKGHFIKDDTDVSDDYLDLMKGKLSPYTYKVKGLDYLGMEGVIIRLRDKAECEYEKDTGDIARYVVKIKSNLLNWKNKIVTLYPSQVQKIHKITHKEIEKQKEKRKRRESIQFEKAINGLFTKIHPQHE